MALFFILNQKLMWFINILRVLYILNIHQLTAVEAGLVNKVKICPQNKTEWQEASSRLNCSNDKNPVNKYHCLPVHDLTTLVEFCYNDTRPRVVKGLCMTYVQQKTAMKGYECATFDEGCPNMNYFSDEAYKFPSCVKINAMEHCFVAESTCRTPTNASTYIKDVTSHKANETTLSGSGVARQQKDEKFVLLLSTAAVFLLILVAVAVYVWKKRNVDHQSIKTNTSGADLDVLLTEVEAEVENLGINYLLQNFPEDKKEKIAKSLNIPREIMFWSKQNRSLFVKYMNGGRRISVYSGRVMIIGCAEAGKTTLVKKLKGETNLTPESTTGIEIHPHVFKLDGEERTIIACSEQDKRKGCLCFTPATIVPNPIKKITTETLGTKQIVQDKVDSTCMHSIPQESAKTVQPETTFYSEKTNFQNPIEMQTISKSDNSVLPDKMHFDHEISNSKQDIDLRDCEASVSDRNLKMVSILDFAGQSVYYACHHIFLSPRAFYILVVDMSEDLKSLATHACEKQGLIYSEWTYADYIRYWLGSIHTYGSKCAPVILVGSHSEGIDDKIKEEFFLNICRILPESVTNHIEKRRVFFVEKNSDINMKELKKCIAETVKSQDHWGNDVPVAWTRIESVLRKSRESFKIDNFANLLKRIQNEDGIQKNTEEELITALKFFHDTGVILFRDEIKDIIILDVQWFVDAFKCIIMDEKHAKLKDKDNLVHFDDLNEYGLLFNSLLEDLWKDEGFIEHKGSLVKHMKHLDMLAELDRNTWYVPCMNKQKYTPEILKTSNVSSTLCLLFEFLPIVIFHRLVVACINNKNMELWEINGKECIYHTVAVLDYEKSHRVLIGIRENKKRRNSQYAYTIEIQVVTTKPRQVNKLLCIKIKEIVCQILTDLLTSPASCENSYEVGYRCIIKPYLYKSEGSIVLENDMKPERDCTSCESVHTIEAESILDFWKSKPDESVLLKRGQEISHKKTELDFIALVQECSDISIPNVDKVMHISQVSPDTIWFNNTKEVVKIDHSGHILYKFERYAMWGSATHTVDRNGHVLFTKKSKIMRMKSNGEDEILFTPESTPLSIYASQKNGDILLSVQYSKGNEYWTKITRYDEKGQLIPEFEYDKIQCRPQISPLYLCENDNTDVCISDNSACLVKVFDKQGKQRFTYDGRPLYEDFSPTGICTDNIGNVLVCNQHKSNPSVHLLDRDGRFLSVILNDRHDIKDPWGLCVSNKGKLYLGQNNCNVIKVFKFLEKD